MTSQPGLVVPPPLPAVSLQKQQPSSSILDPLVSNPLVTSISNVFSAFQDRRALLGLPNPGTVENVSKEVTRDVFLNNSAFSGFRAELQKAFSMSPLFQVCHSFSAGNQQMPPYVFMALYGTNKVFCQGNIESDLSFAARFNYRWNPRWTTKTQTQISPAGGMAGGAAQFQIENDYVGRDFTAQIKAINPSVLDGALTGIYIGSYLQSVTPRLALGLEAVYNRMAANMGPESVLSYAARYRGADWIASGQLLSQGAVSAAYWKRITDKVEAGLDLNLDLSGASGGGAMMGGPARKSGTATLGAKYDFRASNFKAQVDTTGKVACVLEKRVVPLVGITFSGEIDHVKNSAKLGLAVSIEAADEEIMQQQERGLVEPVSPPF